MVGAAVQRRVLCAVAAVFVAAALFLLFGDDQVLVVEDYGSHKVWMFWVPVALGMLLIRWVPPEVPEREMALRLQATMEGHAPGREVVVLAGCAVGFLVGNLLLEPMFHAVDPGLAPLSYHTSKSLFLLFVPLMFIGASGVMRNSHGPDLPRLAARVTEPWRWAGLVAVVCYLALVLVPGLSYPPEMGSAPEHYDFLAALLISYIATAVLEVIFFQVFVQTRLEVLLGRWPAVALVALVYALTSLVNGTFSAGVLSTVAAAVAVQASAGLLYGYLWSRYRNLWLNLLLQGGLVTFVALPV